MAFKYINPGFNVGNLASIHMETHSNIKTYSGGVYLLNGTGQVYFPNVTDSLYFSAFLYRDGYICQVNIYSESGKYVSFQMDWDGFSFRVNGTRVHADSSVTDGTFYLQILSNNETEEYNIYKEGLLLYSYSGNVFNGSPLKYAEFYLGRYGRLANIIISDEYFPPSEKIIALPVANTTATMTNNGDGSYTADEVGESVMQTIDAAKLITSIGEGNTFTGFSLIGNPAYYDGAGMTHLGAMKGASVKESVALPTNTDGKILASWSDNVTQADIANVSLGWQAQV